MAKPININQVEPDINPNTVLNVMNPLEVDFECQFAGQPYVVKAGEVKAFAAPLATHIAKHLAKKVINEQVVSFLETNIKGLDDNGIEKWKKDTKVYVKMQDVEKLQAQLLCGVGEIPAIASEEVHQMSAPEEEKTDVVDVDPGKTPGADEAIKNLKKRKK